MGNPNVYPEQVTSSNINFTNPKLESGYAFIVILLNIFLSLVYLVFLDLIGHETNNKTTFVIGDFLNRFILYCAIFIIPVFVLLYLRKAPLDSVGFQRKGFESSFILTMLFIFLSVWGWGTFLAAFIVTPAILLSWLVGHKFGELKRTQNFFVVIGSLKIQLVLFIISLVGIAFFILAKGTIETGEPLLSFSTLYYFLIYLTVGFGEELAYRGLLQSRIVAWLGKKRGITVTSLLFSIVHIPIWIFNDVVQDLLQLLVILCFVTLISIFFGFIYNKTQNILGVSVIHGFFDMVFLV
ncbi:MAG: lysostaphin resistance A-like protein [Promethearchaeota archaeon]